MSGSSERPDWSEYFGGIAQAVAVRGDCSRRQVGAVLVDSTRRIVGTGYNGAPPGGSSCLAGECPRANSGVAPGSSYDTGPGSCIAVHAEANCLLWADPSRFKGSTIYVTEEPCDGCAKLIAGSGIKRTVVVPKPIVTIPKSEYFRLEGNDLKFTLTDFRMDIAHPDIFWNPQLRMPAGVVLKMEAHSVF